MVITNCLAALYQNTRFINYLVLARLSTLGLLALGAASTSAEQQNTAYARVISSHPVYRQLQQPASQQRCWVESVRGTSAHGAHKRAYDSHSSAIVGSMIGGAIGHAVGRGSKNQRMGTLIGAVFGAAIGDNASRGRYQKSRQDSTDEHIEYCEPSENRSTYKQLVGYDVTYQYSGHRYTTRMRERPGDRLKVAIDVRPVGY